MGKKRYGSLIGKLFGTAIFVALVWCSQPAQAGKNDYLFVWRRPIQFPVNLPITQSATCRFRESLAAGFQKATTDGKSHPPEGISYSADDEDEADTVTFINLDTHSPTVRTNGGQSPLTVLYSDPQMLTLASAYSGGDVETYTVFRNDGVVIHSTQKASPFIGPFGLMEMGYCN